MGSRHASKEDCESFCTGGVLPAGTALEWKLRITGLIFIPQLSQGGPIPTCRDFDLQLLSSICPHRQSLFISPHVAAAAFGSD